MKKINIITLGCEKNTNDIENLSGVLKKQGHQLEDQTNQADAVVVHTCSFIESAKKESIQTILDAAKNKNVKAKLYVTGCMVQQHGKELMEELHEVDGFLGTGQLGQIPTLINKPMARFLDRRDPGGYTDPDADRVLAHKGASANLRLSEGCSHPCTFCVIPKLRGGLQSRPEELILSDAKKLAHKGIQELIIIGQDTGEWGRDLYGEQRLHHLLNKLRNIKGIRWIRLMYMHPYSLTDEVLTVMKESPDIFPYLDMPLQHIDNDILIDMKRLLPEKGVRSLLDKIHRYCPDISLRTTFIVGYPGETEDQFNKLNHFINEGHFDYLGAFPYSKEENTPAGVKADQLDDKVKQERQQALMATYFGVAHQKGLKRIGSEEMTFIEDEEGDTVIGRTRREAPEIDAVVRLPKEVARQGNFVKCKITGYDAFEYTAHPVVPDNRLVG